MSLLDRLKNFLSQSSSEAENAQKLVTLNGVVVGKILEIKKHPNADKLQLVRVDVGPSLPKGERKSAKDIQIVCGAWNIKVGDKVPVATIGAKLPNGMIIKEAEIRGEKSHGMLCAEDELGIGNDHTGILILPSNAEVGTPFIFPF